MKKITVTLLFLVAFVFGAGDCSFALEYSIINDSITTTVIPLSGAMSGAEYYNYDDFADGFPDFGTEADTAFSWLWEDTTTNEISLGLIFNTYGHWPDDIRNYVSADISISGLPTTAYWEVMDDNEAYPYTMTLARWTWGQHTDGGVIGGLNGSWEITLSLYDGIDARPLGVNNWYFLSEGSGKYDNLIDITKGLTISATDPSTPVPEPASFLLFFTGLLYVIGFSKNIKRKIYTV